MTFISQHRELCNGLVLGVASTLLGGIFLLTYGHSCQVTPNHAAPSRRQQSGKESRSIIVKPVANWSQFVLFSQKKYYTTYAVELNDGKVGFPPNTVISLSTSTGIITGVVCSDIIRPFSLTDASAENWIDYDTLQGPMNIFVTGPNPGTQVTMLVTLMSKGKEVPGNALKLLVLPPGHRPMGVEYGTNIKWASNRLGP